MFQAQLLKLALKYKNLGGYAVLIVVVVVMGMKLQDAAEVEVGLRETIAGLKVVVSAKPRVVVEHKTRWRTKTIEGPVRIVEKIVYKPGGVKIVTKEIFRDKIVKVDVKATDDSKTENPICPVYVGSAAEPRLAKRWLVGATFAPWIEGANKSRDSLRLKGGVTLAGRLDVVYGYEPYVGQHHVGLNYRF